MIKNSSSKTAGEPETQLSQSPKKKCFPSGLIEVIAKKKWEGDIV